MDPPGPWLILKLQVFPGGAWHSLLKRSGLPGQAEDPDRESKCVARHKEMGQRT